MPLFRSGRGESPAWGEVEFFEILHLQSGESTRVQRESPRERIYVVSGDCRLSLAGENIRLQADQQSAVDMKCGAYDIASETDASTIVRICGHWGTRTGSSGIFRLGSGENGMNEGDPTPYPRDTVFDNHYHDCDEYWIIVEGRCVAVSEERLFLLGPGDCLATGMGHHHDIPIVVRPVTGVYLEGTLEGRKREGHLWNHRDGPACPVQERI